jgi:hypothetical protein
VILTESTHHLVDVLLVIMKMITVSVKTVHTNVLPVPHGTIVTFVKMLPIEFQLTVNVLMDTMMLVSQCVTHVLSNV